MKYKKGEILLVDDPRKMPHRYKVKVLKDFDTEKDEWWDTKLLEDVAGLNTCWFKGEEPPLRRGIQRILSKTK